MPPHPLPPILTPSLLSSLLSAHPHLPRHSWYLIASVALSALNRPEELPTVLRYALSGYYGLGLGTRVKDGRSRAVVGGGSLEASASSLSSAAAVVKERRGAGTGIATGTVTGTGTGTEPGSSRGEEELPLEEQLRIVRRMREALIKSAPVAGLPKAINALLQLKSATPPHLLDLPPSSPSPQPSSPPAPAPAPPAPPPPPPPDTSPSPPLDPLLRGQAFFGRTYGKVASRVMSQLDRSGTPALGATARLLYGHVLSSPGALSAAETSFVLVAGLVPQDVNAQLKGHLRGALNNGAAVDEVRAVRAVVVALCRAAGMRVLAEEGGEGNAEVEGVGGAGRSGLGLWREEVASI